MCVPTANHRPDDAVRPEDWLADNAPGCLGGAWHRCILQSQVSSRVIVIVHQQQQHVAQMALPEYDDMIVNRGDLGTHTVLMNSET